MADILDISREKMNKTIEFLKEEMGTLRAGRANPKLLDRVQVESWGSLSPINQIANISAPEPRMLVISPWDPKMIGPIEKAIQQSDIGINPTNDGKVIRLVVPELTSERRKELTKVLAKMGEDCKVQLRNIRRDSMVTIKKLEKNNEYTEDDVKSDEAALQKILDKLSAETDKLLADKEKEILSL